MNKPTAPQPPERLRGISMYNPTIKKPRISKGKARRWRYAIVKTPAPNDAYRTGYDKIKWDD